MIKKTIWPETKENSSPFKKKLITIFSVPNSPVGLGFNPKQIVISFFLHEFCLYPFYLFPVKKLPKI
jgi:hypothetical protein